ncbi:hypothetical protein APHAL10511_005327 [Amanita phalloides]|nr:hypothetical protein APHAL10511_005327 [Amanita phalloides]
MSTSAIIHRKNPKNVYALAPSLTSHNKISNVDQHPKYPHGATMHDPNCRSLVSQFHYLPCTRQRKPRQNVILPALASSAEEQSSSNMPKKSRTFFFSHRSLTDLSGLRQQPNTFTDPLWQRTIVAIPPVVKPLRALFFRSPHTTRDQSKEGCCYSVLSPSGGLGGKSIQQLIHHRRGCGDENLREDV